MLEQLKHSFVGFVLVTILVACATSSASAQTPTVDVAGGYAWLHEKDLSIPAGWFGSVGGNVNDWFGLVGAVSGHYKSETEGLASVKLSLHTFAAGPRFSSHSNPVFTPYVQVLFGGGRATGTAKIGSSSSFTETESGFDIQPGAGVDINPTRTVGLRVGVNSDNIRSGGEWLKEFQVIAGVVFRK